mmetsp:Transcript_37418/g.117902  ORF Transcript_37418/g.117902 Transcript_37418/m.117902 type:complete len:671 (-) Transcript_37418:350-2362(-)
MIKDHAEVPMPGGGAGRAATKLVRIPPPAMGVSVIVTPSIAVSSPSRKAAHSVVSLVELLNTLAVTTTSSPGFAAPPLGRGTTSMVGDFPGCTTTGVCSSICREPLIATSDIRYGFPPGAPLSWVRTCATSLTSPPPPERRAAPPAPGGAITMSPPGVSQGSVSSAAPRSPVLQPHTCSHSPSRLSGSSGSMTYMLSRLTTLASPVDTPPPAIDPVRGVGATSKARGGADEHTRPLPDMHARRVAVYCPTGSDRPGTKRDFVRVLTPGGSLKRGSVSETIVHVNCTPPVVLHPSSKAERAPTIISSTERDITPPVASVVEVLIASPTSHWSQDSPSPRKPTGHGPQLNSAAAGGHVEVLLGPAKHSAGVSSHPAARAGARGSAKHGFAAHPSKSMQSPSPEPPYPGGQGPQAGSPPAPGTQAPAASNVPSQQAASGSHPPLLSAQEVTLASRGRGVQSNRPTRLAHVARGPQAAAPGPPAAHSSMSRQVPSPSPSYPRGQGPQTWPVAGAAASEQVAAEPSPPTKHGVAAHGEEGVHTVPSPARPAEAGQGPQAAPMPGASWTHATCTPSAASSKQAGSQGSMISTHAVVPSSYSIPSGHAHEYPVEGGGSSTQSAPPPHAPPSPAVHPSTSTHSPSGSPSKPSGHGPQPDKAPVLVHVTSSPQECSGRS